MKAIEFTNEMAGSIHRGISNVLADKGYTYLGGGIDKHAYLEPKTGQALIIFGYRNKYKEFSPDQRMFIDWINYCNKHENNPHLPKFSGFESFEFRGKNYIQARMEYLVELPESIGKLVYLLEEARKYAGKNNFEKGFEKIADWAEQESFDNDDEPEWFDAERVIEYLGGLEQAKGLLLTVHDVVKFGLTHGFRIDLHTGNYMQRIDGTIVVNDPFVLSFGTSDLKEEKSRKPFEYIGNIQIGNYTIKLDKHILDRMAQRDWTPNEVYSTLNKLPKAKAKLKQLSPGHMFLLHDNTNNLFMKFRVKDTENKIYIAYTVFDKGWNVYDSATIPIIEVA